MRLTTRAAKSLRLVKRRRARRKLPEILAGDVCTPPDYVGVGVQRSGSTWWDNLIASHPDVVSRSDRTKEVHYFDHRYDGAAPGEPEVAYSRFFPRPPGTISGEWTPRYLYDGWALPQLRHSAPDAKILVILRDPVERYASGLTLQHQWGQKFDRNFLQHSFQRGLYASQLERLFSIYPVEQVMVLQFEQCLAAVGPQLRRTFDFLGLDGDHVPPRAQEPQSKSEIAKVQLSSAHEEWLVASYRADVSRLLDLVPDLDGSLWRHFR